MNINIYSGAIWLTSILIGSLDLVIYLGSKRTSSRAFAHSILWVTIWVGSLGIFVSVGDVPAASFFAKLTYLLGSIISASFFYFFLTYPEDNKPSKSLTWFLIITQAIIFYLVLFTDKVIYGAFSINSAHPWGWHFGMLSVIFELTFFGFFGLGIIILYRKFKSCKEPNTRSNLKYMLWTVIVGSIPPSITCIILPRLGYYGLNWLGPVTEIIWIPIIAFSIIRYRQMNVRAVAAEVLAIAMAIILFINIFIDISSDPWTSIATFVAFIFIAYYLIKNILNDARTNDLLTSLTTNLSIKVAEQTAEIRNTLEMEKKARRELDKLNETKDQFIMMTQHNLRAPVNTMRWKIKSMLEDDSKTLSPEIRKGLEDNERSVGRLGRIVDDFLAITRIKPGSSILNISKSSLKPLFEEVFSELDIDIHNYNLTIEYPKQEYFWPEIPIDTNKMRETLLIIIENAIKYNHKDGYIKIEPEIKENSYIVTIRNSGIGLSEKDLEKIHGQHFHRGDEAKIKNPVGMGIGLSVANSIIRAHHGELTVRSDGAGKGATVVIEIRKYS